MGREVTRAEFARLAGVSSSAVTKACKFKLRRAVVGKRIDLDHKAARDYLRKRGIDPTSAGETPAAPSEPAPTDRPAISVPDEIAELTVREVVERFGTKTRYRDWLSALKQIEDIREKTLKNKQASGRLIERELVKAHVFGAIDATNRRLLTDTPRNVAQLLYAMARSGAPLEDAEAAVRDAISSQLASVKKRAVDALRKRKTDSGEDGE